MIGLPILAVGGFIQSFVRNRSLKGMMFNARVEGIAGEISIQNGSIKVHRLEKAGKDHIGLECVLTSAISYDAQGYTLSIEETEQLISALQSAIPSPTEQPERRR
jgi:hypothetical protein